MARLAKIKRAQPGSANGVSDLLNEMTRIQEPMVNNNKKDTSKKMYSLLLRIILTVLATAYIRTHKYT
jgi:hypothetical protein